MRIFRDRERERCFLLLIFFQAIKRTIKFKKRADNELKLLTTKFTLLPVSVLLLFFKDVPETLRTVHYNIYNSNG